MMDENGIRSYFKDALMEDPDRSEAVAAIQTLVECIKLNIHGTIQGLREDLVNAIETLSSSNLTPTITSINSGCELFLRFITKKSNELDQKDYQEVQNILVERGNIFLNKLQSSRKKIGKLANPFINDGATILIHGRSRVVLEVLRQAVDAKKRFTVYVTEADKAGSTMMKDLEDLDIPAVKILDSAVGYIMEKIDFVIVGAEGVVESGGIINKIGTFTVSVCAKEMNKPVYVMAESFKFIRLYPLNQQDLPNSYKYNISKLNSEADLSREHPQVDYTPPAYISLLFTDLGILTPSAISDELIKLYL